MIQANAFRTGGGTALLETSRVAVITEAVDFLFIPPTYPTSR
jgi:hypothetical protein